MLCVIPMAPADSPEALGLNQGDSNADRVDLVGRSPSRCSAVSVKDLFRNVEKERKRMQHRSRGLQIASARDQLPHFINRSPTDAWSLPNFSRPNTRMDTYSVGEQSAVTVNLPLAASQPLAARLCLRARSATHSEAASGIRSLPRQCCDVLGPFLCTECSSIIRRSNETLRYDNCYPDLHTSSENFATTVLVKQKTPGLSLYQIQNKIAKGEINRLAFKEWLRRTNEHAKRKAEWEASRENNQKSENKHPYTFFSSIQDLNKKIFSGRASKKILINLSPQGKTKTKQKSKESFSEQVMPMFLSPRKVKAEASTYRAHYEPPLLPKVCQNVEPSFFAGSEKPYKLPDRLPDDEGSIAGSNHS